MRWSSAWLETVAAALLAAVCATGCTRHDDDARVLDARLVRSPGAALEADLALRFSPVMLDALEHGIALTLTFALDAHPRAGPSLSTERHLRLSYAPLAGQYVVTGVDDGRTRTFARRTQLLAAFDRVRLDLPREWAALPEDTPLALTVALDRSALPGPLRLPALLSSDWHLATAVYRWPQDG
jgi:hypothetical protein